MNGGRLKELRNERNMTQLDLAKLINVTSVSVSGYESGTRSPDIETLIKIADVFDVTTDYLLGRSLIKTKENEKKLINDKAKEILISMLNEVSK